MQAKKFVPFIIGLFSLGYFALLCAPNLTWLCTCCDGTIYLRSAKYFVLSHSTGAPLFNMLNWLVVRIPLGTEFWRLAMLSVIASSLTAVLLYLIARRYTSGWKTYLPSAIWLGSGLVVSQSTIVETYALVTLTMVLAYYLHITNHNKLKYLACAADIGIHHLIGFVLIPLIITDYMNKKSLKPALLSLIGIAFYAIYLPLANREPYVWIGGETLHDYFVYFTNATGLLGGLAILPPNDLIIRLQDFGLIIVGGFAVALILIVYSLIKEFKSKEYLLPSLFLLPLIYYLTDFASQTYVYLMPSFAFGALLATKHTDTTVPMLKSYIPKLALVTACLLIVFNVQLYDIGRTLDPKLTCLQFYEQLDSVDRDALVFGRGWQVVWLYNDDNATNIQTQTSKFIVLEDEEKAHRISKLKDFRDADKLYRTYVINTETQECAIEKWNPTDEAIEIAVSENRYMDGLEQ